MNIEKTEIWLTCYGKLVDEVGGVDELWSSNKTGKFSNASLLNS